MAHARIDLALLRQFRFARVLQDDPLVHSLHVLGSLPSAADPAAHLPAVISLQKTHFSVAAADAIIPELLEQVEPIEANNIYHWLFGWLGRRADLPDVKINVIFPATEHHIAKYSRQRVVMVSETPALYEAVVKPYIQSLPPARTAWVHNILAHQVEAHKILYEDPSADAGFVLLPDMKWDLATVSALYLVAVARAPALATLRDLARAHLPMLRAIRREAGRLVRARWGLPGARALRFYVHYQPSYYHFHVHIVNANYAGFKGVSAGQAHLLEDVISLLELSPPSGPTLLAQMTLTYELGEQHALFGPMLAAQAGQHDAT